MSTFMPTPDVPSPELAAHLPALRSRLEEQREFRISQLVELAAEELEFEEREPDLAPSPGERASREMSALLASAARRALADIESALHRMSTGRYGTCLYCGVPIELARLNAVPQTALCAPCQRGAHLP
ncbi:MAG TPA: TraR/DksA C4-type zinc finger protein [Rugosimonospora sp.]|nr:TraR/DksA C4-type zinc finger protein [Rugosimonospora sp.]